jgi:hypothetical protein
MSRMVTNLELKGAIPADSSCRSTTVTCGWCSKWFRQVAKYGISWNYVRQLLTLELFEWWYKGGSGKPLCTTNPVLRTTSCSTGGTRVAVMKPYYYHHSGRYKGETLVEDGKESQHSLRSNLACSMVFHNHCCLPNCSSENVNNI